jgi:hypothetical protein
VSSLRGFVRPWPGCDFVCNRENQVKGCINEDFVCEPNRTPFRIHQKRFTTEESWVCTYDMARTCLCSVSKKTLGVLGVFNLAENGTIYGYQNMDV